MEMNDQRKKYLPVMISSFILSFLLGALTFFLIDRNAPMNPDRILARVEDDFRADGPISGSWIEMTKVPWSKYAYSTDVYYGGISRMENGTLINYEFIADAYSGSLVDLYELV